MKRFLAYGVCLLCILSAFLVFAEIRSFLKEYTYQASELDSKTSCRAIAIEQVKRELLEELGTYVESTTVVKDFQIEKDEIRTISAGVVQTKVLDEKWDGKEYWLKAEVSADPDEVASSIAKVRSDTKLADELAETQQEKENALKEVERLKQELASAQADQEKLAQYNQAVNQIQASDSFEQGTAMAVAGDYEGAAKAYDRTIELRPNDAKAIFNRSIVYIYLGDYQRATSDLDRAMAIRPANTNIYYQRAAAYKDLRERRLATQPQPSSWFGRPKRPVPQPKDDPLRKYLEKKRTENNLVRVNPFQPRPRIKSQDRPLQVKPLFPGQKLDRDSKRDPATPYSAEHKNPLEQQDRTWPRKKQFQQQDRLTIQEPQKPVLRDRNKFIPPDGGAIQQPPDRPVLKEVHKPALRDRDKITPHQAPKPQVVKPHVEPVKKKTLKELQEERKSKKSQD